MRGEGEGGGELVGERFGGERIAGGERVRGGGERGGSKRGGGERGEGGGGILSTEGGEFTGTSFLMRHLCSPDPSSFATNFKYSSLQSAAPLK